MAKIYDFRLEKMKRDDRVIEDLNLTVGAYNFLKKNKIKTIKELRMIKKEDLYRLEGMNENIYQSVASYLDIEKSCVV